MTVQVWTTRRTAAVLMAAALLAVPGPGAAQAGRSPASLPAAAGIDAAETRALTAAKELGRPVEVAGTRTPTSQTIATPGGTLLLEQYAVPRWAQDADQRWRQIDRTLESTADGIAPRAALGGLRLSPGGAGPFARLNAGDGQLAISWPHTLPAPRLEGDTAVYPTVLPGVDLRVQALTDGFSWVLVVHDAAAAANPSLERLRFPVTTTNVQLRARPAGGFDIVGKDGAIHGGADAAAMWEAPQRGQQLRHLPDSTRSAELPTTLTGSELAVNVDLGLLRGPGTKYPVVIDPSTTINKLRWGYANQSNSNRNDGIVRVGNNPDGSGIYRSFFAFNLSSLGPKLVRGAKFVTEMTHSWSCGNSQISLYSAHDLAAAGRSAWDGPNLITHLQRKAGHAHKPSDGGGCSNDPQPDMYMEFASTALTNYVSASKGEGNVTFALSTRDENGGGEATTSNWKKFDQALTKLSVEYNSAPNTPAAAQLTAHADYTAPANACVAGTGRPLVRSLTPWLKATLSDADGGTLIGTFALQQWNGTTWVGVTGWPKTDTGVPSGSKAEVQISPAAPGTGRFRWQVQAKDVLNAVSGWSPWCEFDTDNTPPGVTPTVNSADGVYPQTPPDQELHGGLGQSAQFAFGASGVTDVRDYVYQVNGGPQLIATATALGGDAVAWVTPTRVGENVLTVRSRDSAGNSSPPYDYRFLVDIATAPKHVWQFDEGTGATAATTPPGGPSLTMTTARWGTALPLGTHQATGADRSASFISGTDVATSAGPVIETSRSFSVAAWLRLDVTSATSSAQAVSQDGNRVSGFGLWWTGGTNKWAMVGAESDVDNTARPMAMSLAPGTLGVWTHVAGVYDKGTKQIRLYINGVYQTSAPLNAGFNATGPLVLGRGKWNGVARDPWFGGVNDLRVWDRAIDADLDLKPLAEPVLVGQWEMEDGDEEEPRNATDASGYRRQLTLSGGAQWCEGYNFSGGLCFDGLTGYATAATVLNTNQSSTVSAWLKWDGDSTTASRTALSQGGANVSGFFVGCRLFAATNTMRWSGMRRSVDSTTSAPSTLDGGPCTPGVWTHVTLVHDAIAKAHHLYINGVRLHTQVYLGTWHAPGSFTVGRAQWRTPTDYFNGSVDRVRVWAGVLPDADIAALAQEP